MVLSLGLAVGFASGCAEVPPPEVQRVAAGRPEPALHLVDRLGWRLFEVERQVGHPERRRIELREEAPGEPAVVEWEGRATRWLDQKSALVVSRIYLRHRHSAEYRFRHPWNGEEWFIEARTLTRRVFLISAPVEPENGPRFLFLPAQPSLGPESALRAQVGELAFDGAARRLFFGHLAGSEVEIERVDALSWDRKPGVRQHLVARFPDAGEFVVRIDGLETARFLQRRDGGSRVTYRLAIRRAASEVDRDLSLGIFLAFDRMRDFIVGLRRAEIQ